MKKILFVCVENSCRSQIAEAFAHIYGKGKIEAFSAGSAPSGKVNPKAIVAMREIGYDLTKHSSKSLLGIPQEEYEYVITMGCGETCPSVPAKQREDWGIPDPKNLSPEEFRQVRTMIEDKVKKLLKESMFFQLAKKS